MTATVLLVEDERKLRELVRTYLERAGLAVLSTSSGAEALTLASEAAPDLVVLDLGLPDVPGETVARELRAAGSVPILMLTAKAGEEDRIAGLELGADDYVTKPFNPRELVARIRAVLRRTQPNDVSRAAGEPLKALRFAGWELNLRTRQLISAEGDRVDLTQSDFALLSAFLGAPQRILSREQLLELSRGHDDEVFDRSIDVQILRLRRKLESNPSRPELIRTERGAGYFLNARVEAIG
jgi:DNA-binding response OmpR family regulator